VEKSSQNYCPKKVNRPIEENSLNLARKNANFATERLSEMTKVETKIFIDLLERFPFQLSGHRRHRNLGGGRPSPSSLLLLLPLPLPLLLPLVAIS
jgi:hypothetical protein